MDSTWEENLHAKIFKPLGMERTVSNRKDFFESQNYSLAYGKYGLNPEEQIDMMHLQKIAPAGAIASSVNDMSKWMQTWLNKLIFLLFYVFEAMFHLHIQQKPIHLQD